MVGDAIDDDLGVTAAVGRGTHGGAKAGATCKIAGHVVAAEHDIGQGSVACGGVEPNERGAQVHEAHACGRAGAGDLKDRDG